MKQEELIEHLEEVNRVASEYLKGMNETEISRELDIPRPRVVKYLEEWKGFASNSEAIRSRAREALAGADLHYNKLIKQIYDTIDDADVERGTGGLSANQALTLRMQALKMTADLEARRIDMLQRAGLLENQELADKLIEQEKQQAAIMKIITDVVGACPVCKPKVLQRMSGLGSEPIVIVEPDHG